MDNLLEQIINNLKILPEEKIAELHKTGKVLLFNPDSPCMGGVYLAKICDERPAPTVFTGCRITDIQETEDNTVVTFSVKKME